MRWLLTSAEFGAGDGRGDGNVKALGCVVLTVTGNQEAMVYLGTDLWGDTIALVSHDDKAIGSEWLGIDVVAIEQCAIDGEVLRQGVDEL